MTQVQQQEACIQFLLYMAEPETRGTVRNRLLVARIRVHPVLICACVPSLACAMFS